MDRKQALEALLVKVEAGEWPDDYGAAPLLSHPSDCLALAAFEGSLDAAKALHEAVLPPINQYTIDEGPSGCGAQIAIWPNGLSSGDELIFNGYDCTPARAWLIAILKAYRSKVQE